jgi:hypothetical protein
MKGDIIVPKFEAEHLAGYKFPVIVVYNDKTLDYMGFYVARLWDGVNNVPSNIVVLKKTRDEITAIIPVVLTRIRREPDDDKNIIESYI